MASKDSNEEKSTGFYLTTILVSIAIIGLWLGNWYILKDYNVQERGTLGDMFGAINALFSGFSLAGIVLAILLQRKELKLQREELSDTREEFKTQNATLKIQRFENTFFNLLNLHHQIVSAIDYKYYKSKEREGIGIPLNLKDQEKESVTITGRDVFRHRYNTLYRDLRKNPENYQAIYLKHFEDAQTDFGHYFRHLYRLIKLVDETDFFYDISETEPSEIFEIKYRYTSIIRSQLSSHELAWLFYNCLSINGVEKFKPLIETYSIFKNFPNGLIPFHEHLNLYDKRAYGQ